MLTFCSDCKTFLSQDLFCQTSQSFSLLSVWSSKNISVPIFLSFQEEKKLYLPFRIFFAVSFHPSHSQLPLAKTFLSRSKTASRSWQALSRVPHTARAYVPLSARGAWHPQKLDVSLEDDMLSVWPGEPFAIAQNTAVSTPLHSLLVKNQTSLWPSIKSCQLPFALSTAVWWASCPLCPVSSVRIHCPARVLGAWQGVDRPVCPHTKISYHKCCLDALPGVVVNAHQPLVSSSVTLGYPFPSVHL